MWKRTKPRSMIPVTAMTHFLPTAERQKRTIGFPDGRPGWTGAGPCSVVDCVAVIVCAHASLSPARLRGRNLPFRRVGHDPGPPASAAAGAQRSLTIRSQSRTSS